MGIPLDPGPGLDDSCGGCFPSNETPTSVIACFEGIEIGDTWLPYLPGPPNGMIVLQNQGGCDWYGEWLPWHAWYRASFDEQSLLDLYYSDVTHAFVSDPAVPCTGFFTNSLICSANAYCGGSAVIVCTKTPPLSKSMKEIAALLNLEDDLHTKFDVWPISASETMVRFARWKKGMNILLKISSI